MEFGTEQEQPDRNMGDDHQPELPEDPNVYERIYPSYPDTRRLNSVPSTDIPIVLRPPEYPEGQQIGAEATDTPQSNPVPEIMTGRDEIPGWADEEEVHDLPETETVQATARLFGIELTPDEATNLVRLAKEAKDTAPEGAEYDYCHPLGLYVTKRGSYNTATIDYTPQDESHRPDDPAQRTLFAMNLIRAGRDYLLTVESGLLDKPGFFAGHRTNKAMAGLAIEHYDFTTTWVGANQYGQPTYNIEAAYENVRDHVLSEETRGAERMLAERLRRYTQPLRETAAEFGQEINRAYEEWLRELASEAKGFEDPDSDIKYIYRHPTGVTVHCTPDGHTYLDYTPQDYRHRPSDDHLRTLFARDINIGLRDFCLLVEAGQLEGPKRFNGETNKEMADFLVKHFGCVIEQEGLGYDNKPACYVHGEYETVRAHVFSGTTRDAVERLTERLKKNSGSS